MAESCDGCNEECKYSKECLGEGVKFERIRRITGYLVGSLERFNDAKYSEVIEREKHETC